jgi:ParB family chromosome partitioning protein
MGRSLGQIAHAAEQARALIANGSAVVEIPTDKVDSSFIADRLEGPGVDFESLVEAIREAGQRTPILVRPHPDNSERYQVVFGHRRLRAAAQLCRPVRAVVQNMSDEELVVAQGQENSARTDLTYIERGLFAVELETRGFDRRLIMAALAVEKTQLSKLLAVTKSVPRDIVLAIGPAPKAGRPRWTALGERLALLTDERILDEVLRDTKFKEADSDSRFLMLFERVGRQATDTAAVTTPCLSDDGRRVATVERRGTRVCVAIDGRDEPEFGEFLAAQLPGLHREFLRNRETVRSSTAE